LRGFEFQGTYEMNHKTEILTIMRIKRALKPFRFLYELARKTYRFVRVDLVIRKYLRARLREKCYREFECGQRRVARHFGGIPAEFEAFSPKNYFHLIIGSQNEDAFMGKVFSHVRKGDVVLDVGGHVGMWRVPFAKIVGETGRVFVFEPEPQGFEALKNNISLNGLDNVEVLNMAVTDRDSKGTFYVRPDKDTHSVFREAPGSSPLKVQHEVVVDAVSVDRLLREGKIQQPDFIKIDAEGAELQIIAGMKEAAKKVKAVLVEIHLPALKMAGIEDPYSAVEGALTNVGLNQFSYLDESHILALQ